MTHFHRFLGALALLATLILSLLPGGRAMKYLGPCGQQLCVCPEPQEIEPASHSCCEILHSKAVVNRTLTLDEETLSSLQGKLLSWTDDLTPTFTMQALPVCDEEMKSAVLPVWHSSYGIPVYEIPHPPPRA